MTDETKHDTNEDLWREITPCESHRHLEHDCEHCSTQMTQMTAVMDQLQAEAAHRAEGLGKHGVQMPQDILNQIRIELILDTILGDQKNRMLFEGEYGRRVLLTLKNAQAEVTKQTLAPQQGLTVVRDGMHRK